MLSDTYNNNLSLSVAKTSTFSEHYIDAAHLPSQLSVTALSVNTGPISETVVLVSHLDTKHVKIGSRLNYTKVTGSSFSQYAL